LSSVLPRYLVVIALALGMAGSISAQSLAPKDSPFQPAPFQFTGLRLEADGTRVCIYAEKDQRSRWIAVGAIVDGIKVLSYNSEEQRAVISADGATRELALQHGVAGAQTTGPIANLPSSPAAAPTASPVPASAPATAASAQRDDRMLVSDLLELSIEQRQAYANAQKAAVTPAAETK
jgi:hypothetical protein